MQNYSFFHYMIDFSDIFVAGNVDVLQVAELFKQYAV